MTPTDPAAKLRQMLGVGPRELLTMADLVRDYPSVFPSTEAARKWVHRHVPFTRAGRKVLVDRADLHRYFDQHREQRAS